MVRLILIVIFAVGFLWYMTKDAEPPAKIAEEPRETLELAKQGVEATEQMAAQMAQQSDAIRDQARASSIGIAEQAAQMQEDSQEPAR